LPFYCGRVVLRASFHLKKKSNANIYLALNGAEMASASIKVNGKMCGTLRWPPYVLDISKAAKAGENQIELNMATTLVNAFGPNRRAGIKQERAVGPHSFIRMDRYQEKYELFDFGLESVAVYVE
jgi:hypothetical protein